MARTIRVVGAVIVHDGLVLCARRGETGSLPGLWEFPGGKVEPDESPAAALEREIVEELACRVRVGTEITTTTYEYPFATVVLTTFYCTLVSGVPTPSEHSAVRWLAPAALTSIEWAPADLPAVAIVQADHS